MDHNGISDIYQRTDESPNKRYSLLPTVLHLLSPLEQTAVLDLGCGSGFLTLPIAKNAKRVIGLDLSKEQLEKAVKRENIEYKLSDVFSDDFPRCDRICVPFVLNYASSVEQLELLLDKSYQALDDNGKIVMVWQISNGAKRFGKSKFGAVMEVEEDYDESNLKINLYDGGLSPKKLCAVNGYYYTPDTIEALVEKVGFVNFQWHKPVVSEEGIGKFGKEFWKGYERDCGLAYATAEK
jgi:toxoflavin synthase